MTTIFEDESSGKVAHQVFMASATAVVLHRPRLRLHQQLVGGEAAKLVVLLGQALLKQQPKMILLLGEESLHNWHHLI